MNRRSFIQWGTSAFGFLSLSSFTFKNKSVIIQLFRHATLLIEIDKIKFLIDPMLSAKEAMDPVKNAGNDLRIPLVDMPISSEAMDNIINSVDAVIVTHTHRDHWDA